MRSFVLCALLAGAVLATAPPLADDVSDTQRMLCAPMVVHECRTDGDCVAKPPWESDIGPFFEIDLDSRRLAGTERDRTTAIKNVEREGELLVVQGYELGRAFSIVVSEPSGFFTGTITLDDGALTVFGACKPSGKEE